MSARPPVRLVSDDPDGAYRLDEQVGHLLRKANQRHLAIFGKAIPDLTPPQFAALAKLAEAGEAQGRMGQNQLGQSIAMDAATVKGVIDRLKARGLVELASHDSDRRRLVVSLTAAGRETVAALTPLAQAISDETLAPLNPREATTLLRLLARLT